MIRFIYGNKKDFNDMKRAKRLSDEDIQHMIDDVTNVLLDKIRRNDDDNWTYLATGDTMVIGLCSMKIMINNTTQLKYSFVKIMKKRLVGIMERFAMRILKRWTGQKIMKRRKCIKIILEKS